MIAFLCLGIIISKCRSIYTIYLFTLISGTLSGIKYSSITKMNTQNKEYEPYCLIEEERTNVIGGTLGLLISQFIYDISSKLYLLGYLILIVVRTLLSIPLKRISAEDAMESIDESKVLYKKSRNNTIIVTSLFATLEGFWCMDLNGLTELAPLISNEIGYLEFTYTVLEIILLLIISRSIIQKIKNYYLHKL